MIEAAEIQKMTIAERVRTMERLWDSLCTDEDQTPSPSWHLDVLAERKARVQRGDVKLLTLDQLKKRISRSK